MYNPRCNMFLRHLTGFSRKHGRISDIHDVPVIDSHVLTLDPNKFAEKKQQRLHIGNLRYFRPFISLHKHSSPVVASRIAYDMTDDAQLLRLPYPPDTKAFLYYSMSPEKPRIAGELRLRVASSDDHSSFESGSDLLITNGQPWSRPLYLLKRHHSLLYGKLREERLVPDDLDTVLSTLPPRNFGYRRIRPLYTLNDTFIVDFSNFGLYFLVITEQGVEKVPLHHLFFDSRKMCRGQPYTGSALARFERSTLPDHRGTRTVVLRFLKIITPVKCVIPLYDDYICCPKEGELYWRTGSTIMDPPVWSVNIDTPEAMIRGLQLLWYT